jgi:8-oxo-dGTP diphosphatase
MPTAPRHSVSVAAAIVRHDGRLLVVRRRDNGQWEPPGGVLELHESIPDGLAREVLEETGLTVSLDALAGVYKNMSRGIVALVFRCSSIGGDLTTGAESADFLWASDDQLDGLMEPVYAVRLRDALRYTGSPAIRTHDGVRVLA